MSENEKKSITESPEYIKRQIKQAEDRIALMKREREFKEKINKMQKNITPIVDGKPHYLYMEEYYQLLNEAEDFNLEVDLFNLNDGLSREQMMIKQLSDKLAIVEKEGDVQ